MNTIGTFGAAAAVSSTGMFVERSLAVRATAMGVDAEKLSASDKHVASLAGYDWALVTYAAAYLLAARAGGGSIRAEPYILIRSISTDPETHRP